MWGSLRMFLGLFCSPCISNHLVSPLTTWICSITCMLMIHNWCLVLLPNSSRNAPAHNTQQTLWKPITSANELKCAMSSTIITSSVVNTSLPKTRILVQSHLTLHVSFCHQKAEVWFCAVPGELLQLSVLHLRLQKFSSPVCDMDGEVSKPRGIGWYNQSYWILYWTWSCIS